MKDLDRIAARGSQGVILKAPEVPEVTAAVGRLVAARHPGGHAGDGSAQQPAVLAYVGIDNRAAGATAAYLIRQWLADRPGHVLVTISRGSFRNEEEREMGFRSGMRGGGPVRRLVEVTDSDGLDSTQRALVLAALERDPEINAVYSIGGGNTATIDAFATLGRGVLAFVAHDLDHDDTQLAENCPRYSTTTCARTCGAPARRSCEPSRRCRTRVRSCRRRSRW